MCWIVPPRFLAIDIETTAGNPADAEEWARRCWSPSRQWKAATIGERYLEVVAKKEEQLALMDTAPILTVALRTEADIRVLHWLSVDDSSVAGVPMERYPDEREMLRGLRNRLEMLTEETMLIGHNLKRFDLPKLRFRMLHAGLRLPQCLVYRDQPVYDTMAEWARFTVDDRQYVGLSELLDACGLGNYKCDITGRQVPDLFRAGQHATILAYAALDVAAQWNVAMRMLGMADDQPTPQTCGASATGGHAAVEEAAAREVSAGANGTTPAAGQEIEAILQSLKVM